MHTHRALSSKTSCSVSSSLSLASARRRASTGSPFGCAQKENRVRSVLRNDLLPPRYPVCGLRLSQVPAQFRRPFWPPAEFGLGARY